MADQFELFTIGHSNQEREQFLELLRGQGISAVADVRSVPYSRFVPRFNREELRIVLLEKGIAYVYLGLELGARRSEPDAYGDGYAKYESIAKSVLFQEGLKRVRKGLKTHRIALMCAEKDPIFCHRSLIICRAVRTEVRIHHILEAGVLESHEQTEHRILNEVGIGSSNLFHTKEELLTEAYERQTARILPEPRDERAE